MKDNSKKMKWFTLAFIAFSAVWGFGNLVNGFIYFNGIQAIFSWIFVFALYFIPYALMVGELGSAFKSSGAGVSSWISKTIGRKAAYFAAWTYWACHITYISSKGATALKGLSWVIFGSAEVYDELPTVYIQLAAFVIILLFCLIASRGVNPLKKIAGIAGTSIFIMSLLYILLMFAAPAINPEASFVQTDFSFSKLIPKFDWTYITSLSILIFAVGGVEKISPYVNSVEKPEKGFPKGIIVMVVLVMSCAILGTIAMSRMFDPAEIAADKNSYIANASYMAFKKLGEYYHIGNALLILFAICNTIATLASLLVSIDAPLRMLLGNEETREYLPEKLLKQNKYGAYVNGIILVAVLSGGITLIQALIPGADNILAQATKLNSVCMPLRYLWVFVAYYALRKSKDQFPADYRFVKRQGAAKFFAIWCFAITFLSCIFGMYSDDPFIFILNIATPIILMALGLVMPWIKKREQKKAARRR